MYYELDLKSDFDAYIQEIKSITSDIESKEGQIALAENDDIVLQSAIGSVQCANLKSNLANVRFEYSLTSNLFEHRKELFSMYELKKNKVNAIKSLVSVVDMPHMCPICFERSVDSFLKTCGHSFCGECIRRNKNTKCPVCRSDYFHTDIRSLIFS